jgi:hypothetical protein
MVWAQDKMKLPKELNEISGLEKLNDTVLIAVNDSGNSPDIFFITLKGKILNKCHVINASNNDWEDLTMDDKGYLYIADVGNNMNDRRDLCVLKVNADKAFKNDSVTVQKIAFSYVDQTAFPPDAQSFKYDCEAIYWRNDSLHLITKNRSEKPKEDIHVGSNPYWDRFPEDYVIPDVPGNCIAQHSSENILYLHSVRGKGIKDLVTAVDYADGIMAVLTYSELRTFRLNKEDGELTVSKGWGTKVFKKLEQREAIAIYSKKKIFVAAEKHPLLGGPFLYKKTFE